MLVTIKCYTLVFLQIADEVSLSNRFCRENNIALFMQKHCIKQTNKMWSS